MFGSEAAKLLNYVECFPGGFRKGTIMQKECFDVGIEGFPTWVINGQVINLLMDDSLSSFGHLVCKLSCTHRVLISIRNSSCKFIPSITINLVLRKLGASYRY